MMDHEQKELTVTIVVTCASLSLVGALFTLTCFALIPKLRRVFSFRLVFFITLNDITSSIFYLMNPVTIFKPEGGYECQTQAFALGYFDISSMMWTAAAACTMHIAVESALNLRSAPLNNRLICIYFCFCQIGPILPSVMPFFFNAYGHSGIWCWVKSGDGESLEIIRMFAYYIWAWLVTFYLLFVYWKVFSTLSTVADDRNFEGLRKVWEILRLYPSALIFILLFGTVNRIYQAFGTSPFYLMMMEASTETLLGFLDMLIFANNPMVRREVRGLMGSVFGRLSLKEDLFQPLDQKGLITDQER
eukprot:jgi/Bigna1/145130/aug1.95_g19838